MADIEKLLSSSIYLHKKRPPLLVERTDLIEVRRPYLIVKGLEDWLTGDIIEEHFVAEADGEAVESVVVDSSGTAVVKFSNPKVALRFKSEAETELTGCTLQLKISYEVASTDKTWLSVQNFPPLLLRKGELSVSKALGKFFLKHKCTDNEPTECRIIDGVVYLSFEDPKDMKSIVSNPPKVPFYAKRILDISTVPASQVSGIVQSEATPVLEAPFSPASSMNSSFSERGNFNRDLSIESTTSAASSILNSSNPEFSRLRRNNWQRNTSSSSEVHFEIGEDQDASLVNFPAHSANHLPQDNFLFVPSGVPTTQGINDQDADVPSDQTPCVATMDTKILVDDVPPAKRNEHLIKSYLLSLAQVSCNVKRYGNQFLATFNSPINFEDLKEKATKMPLGDCKVSLYQMDPTRTVQVAGLKESVSKHYLKLHFEYSTGKNSVQNVDILPSNRANITFFHRKSVEVAMFSVHLWTMEDNSITITEFYDFMSLDEEGGNIQTFSTFDTVDRTWIPVEMELSVSKSLWIKACMQGLNDKLKPLNATCTVRDAGTAESPSCLVVSPQSGSESMENWDNEVQLITEKELSLYSEESLVLPDTSLLSIFPFSQSLCGPKLHIKYNNGILSVGGDRNEVEQAMSKLLDFMDKIMSKTETKQYSEKHFQYLVRFSKRKCEDIDGGDVKFDLSGKTIQVKGTRAVCCSFWEMIAKEIENIQEKKVTLNQEEFKLLSSKRGIKKIEEIMDVASSDMYNFEDCSLCLLSPTGTDSHTWKSLKGAMKNMLDSQVIPVSQTHVRYCQDLKWGSLVGKLEDQAFVSITVDQSSGVIRITGEKLVVSNVKDRIEKFLSERVSVEESFTIGIHQWKVINQNLMTNVEAIQQDLTKSVTIIWPKKVKSEQAKIAVVVIKGEPTSVDDAKARLQALCDEVCCLKEKICIPAAIQVVGSMDDRVCALEANRKASIEVQLLPADAALSSHSARNLGPRLCSATLPNNVQLSVYSGDFTSHSADTIINFVQLSPDPSSDSNLRQLFGSSDHTLQDEFDLHRKSFLYKSPGQLIKMKSTSQLRCSQLCHALLPCWTGGKENEGYYLESCLEKLASDPHLTTVLLTPVCSGPLNYPAAVFADKLITVFSKTDLFPDLTSIIVYVGNPAHASEFETQFKDRKLNLPSVSTRAPTSIARGRAISHSIDSFITLTKGDLLQQQAEVYVNSTNTNLELKSGLLSNVLLKACGEDLQKECSKFAPLRSDSVVTTPVKNVKCDVIYHVMLPDYSDMRSTRKFRSTVQAILRTIKDNSPKSVAFPSLAVGSLHFPARVSAEILYEEIIDFCARNPALKTKFLLVIYDQKTYDEFSKVHASKMSCLPHPVPNKGAAAAGTVSTMLSIENSDISEEDSDIIVNTTTEKMELKNGAVSKALLKKAGSSLQDACNQYVQSGLKLDKGQIVTTNSFGHLKCKKLIHAHVPLRADAVKIKLDCSTLIHDIVQKCLEEAEKLQVKSISFPAFGFGQGGYSIDEVSHPMFRAMQAFGKMSPKHVDTIKIVIYDQAMYDQFSGSFVAFFKISAQLHRLMHSIAATITGKSSTRSVELRSDDRPHRSSSVFKMPIQFKDVSNSVLLFEIYAVSNTTCKEIAAELKQWIKERCVDEPIENPIIQSLPDTDAQEIVNVGKEFSVKIDIQSKIGRIIIQGEKTVLLEAKIKVNAILVNIEKAQNELKMFSWKSQDADDEEEYSPEDSLMLERARARGLQGVEITIDGIDLVVDLGKMEERSKRTGKVRKIVREKKKLSVKFPDTWEPQPQQDGVPVTLHCVEVQPGSQEYQDALKRFHETIGQPVTITKLERVQNPIEYSKHVALQETIYQKHHKKVDVKRVFHGSKEESIKLIATRGFNRNFAADANAALYGQGIYFSLKSSYSAMKKYAVPNKDGIQNMFICSMIIGEYTVGNNAMKVAPILNAGTLEVYDTLVENKDNPTIFVALTDAQVYPEYLVSFKAGK